MIYIKNVSPKQHPSLSAEYALKVNDEHILSFYHRPEQGLAECLRKAAEAVDKRSGQ